MTRKFIVTAVPPTVTAIGVTKPDISKIEEALAYRNAEWITDEIENDPNAIIEFGGRVCYDSFHNPASRTRTEYIRDSIIAHDHGSVLEHTVVNFAVLSLPRSTQLELIRHRVGVAYSWRSTRFVDNWLEFIVPPSRRDNDVLQAQFIEKARHDFDSYEATVELMKERLTFDESMSKTLKSKRIKEGARADLPNSLGSDGLFSANVRAIRHIVLMRTDPHADESIREFAYALYKEAGNVLGYDGVFEDFTEEEQPWGVPHVKRRSQFEEAT